ncbi:MAG: sulfurtransferase [Vibrio sp.]
MNPRNPLVSASWLFDHLSDDNLILLDATTENSAVGEPLNLPRTYIPNSQPFDLEKVFVDLSNPLPNTMPTPEHFQQHARLLGINQDSVVVIYDARAWYSAPRAWWIFKSMGFDNVYVLDGGLPAWINLGYNVTNSYSQQNRSVGNIKATYFPENVLGAGDVLAAIDDPQTQIIDVRSQDRFLGKVAEPREGMRSGHIPNSSNLPFPNVLDGLQFKDQDSLKALFEQAAWKADLKQIVSCGSGMTACITILAAYACGYQNLAVYDGSWSEWGANPDLPIA